MSDEQVNVANTASTFLGILQNAGVDWRLGVTTTEAYKLEVGDTGETLLRHRNFWTTPAYPYGPDEIIDVNTGLRGDGFLSSSDDPADVAEKFVEYVTVDAGCDLTSDGHPLDANICGDGLERGLESALFVLRQGMALSPDEDPRRHVRPDAQKYVIWVSDEEDQELKEIDNVYQPLPEGAQRDAITQSYISQYQELEIEASAVVGDRGLAQGGICGTLASGGSVGAQYGQGYIEVATALGGKFGSVCNPDLEATMRSIVQSILGKIANLTLKNPPIATSIRVALDGQLLERSRSLGWDYNAESNAIVLYGITLTNTSKLAVGYRSWIVNDG